MHNRTVRPNWELTMTPANLSAHIIISIIFLQAELHAQFDMKDGAAEPYREFPAKATGNNRFDATPNITDWYETVKLNYGVDYQNGGTCHFSPTPDTWIKMLDILLFWASKRH